MVRSSRALGGVGVPLVLGALVYVLLRPHETWLTSLLTRWWPIASIRPSTVALGASLPSIVLDVAPDFAWAAALGALLAATCSSAPRLWFWLGLAFVGGYELLQLAQLIPGTWDPADLVAQLFGFAAAFAWSRAPSVALDVDALSPQTSLEGLSVARASVWAPALEARDVVPELLLRERLKVIRRQDGEIVERNRA